MWKIPTISRLVLFPVIQGPGQGICISPGDSETYFLEHMALEWTD